MNNVDAYDIYEHVSNLEARVTEVQAKNEALHDAVRDAVHTLLAGRRHFVDDAAHREVVYQVSMKLVELTPRVRGIEEVK